jgi:hypothetical protein
MEKPTFSGLSIKWGYFDEATQELVFAFQSQNGLTVDGIVGKDTLVEMSSLITDSTNIINISGKDILEKDLNALLPTSDVVQSQLGSEITENEIVEVFETNESTIQDSIANAVNTTFNQEALIKHVGDTLVEIPF